MRMIKNKYKILRVGVLSAIAPVAIMAADTPKANADQMSLNARSEFIWGSIKSPTFVLAPQKMSIFNNDKPSFANIDRSSITITKQPKYGTIIVNRTTGEVTYRLNDPHTAAKTDNFSYKFKDKNGHWSNVAIVTVKIPALPKTPTPPPYKVEAKGETVSLAGTIELIWGSIKSPTFVLAPVKINIFDNDSISFPNIDHSSITITKQPKYGTITVNTATGEVTYKLNDSHTSAKTDSFSYKFKDRNGHWSNVAIATVKIPKNNTLYVRPAPTPEPIPSYKVIANDETVTLESRGRFIWGSIKSPTFLLSPNSLDLFRNESISFPNIDRSSIVITKQPKYGTISIDRVTGKVTYTLNNSHVTAETDSFSYKFKDRSGHWSNVATATVKIPSLPKVYPAPAYIVHARDDMITTSEKVTVIDVLVNDFPSKPNLDHSSLKITQQAKYGNCKVESGRVKYTLTNNAGRGKEDICKYTVRDNAKKQTSNEGTITISILPDDYVEKPYVQPTTSEKDLMHKLRRLTWGPNAEVLDSVESAGGFTPWLNDQLTSEPRPALDSGYDPDDYPAQHRLDTYQQFYYRSLYVASTIRPMHSKRYLQTVMGSFWDNHFSTAINGEDRDPNELYDSDNFYDNAFGNFGKMLEMSAKSYTMSRYLNGYQNQKGKINENYAREVMELHTLGVDSFNKSGGYTQADIMSLAKILSGWSYRYDSSDPAYKSRYKKYWHNRDTKVWERNERYERLYHFNFFEQYHDTSTKSFRGEEFVNSGVTEGERALKMLADSPATAKFVCQKLARKFVSDAPSDTTVNGCKDTFLRYKNSDNQIKEVLKNIFDSREFKSQVSHNNKMKDNQEYFISLARGIGVDATRYSGYDRFSGTNMGVALSSNRLKQPFHEKDIPTGYGETSDIWNRGDHHLNRIIEANRLISGLDDTHLSVYFAINDMYDRNEIIRHLVLIYLGGYATDKQVELFQETLGDGFDLGADNADSLLKNLLYIMATMPKTHQQ